MIAAGLTGETCSAATFRQKETQAPSDLRRII
jgi:hypothetical protein